MRRLPRSFYARDPRTVARALLGRVLVSELARTRVSARIVEVEAYRGANDPASHAWRGRTARNAVMFGPAGHAYVYFTYGMHYCFNVVCEREGVAGAVLLRALEPLEGPALLRRRRRVHARERLLRGPGCVGQGLALTLAHDGLDLVTGPLWIADIPPERGGARPASGPRIGIRFARERPWRYWLRGNACVSGPAARRAGDSR